jgi:hypothetical protein
LRPPGHLERSSAASDCLQHTTYPHRPPRVILGASLTRAQDCIDGRGLGGSASLSYCGSGICGPSTSIHLNRPVGTIQALGVDGYSAFIGSLDSRDLLARPSVRTLHVLLETRLPGQISGIPEYSPEPVSCSAYSYSMAWTTNARWIWANSSTQTTRMAATTGRPSRP